MMPINRPVRAVTRDGKVINGRRLNEDTYTVQLLDEQGERIVLMLEGAEHSLPHLLQQFRESGSRGEVCAHHQRVDEVADQSRQIRPVPAGRGRAD